ncbi:hypothetical protein TYRP_016245 [Tyrophagus putrescentiae]|nr:hypothetical protein TYRP_016245 [Tyrophagus putrescentiae]
MSSLRLICIESALLTSPLKLRLAAAGRSDDHNKRRVLVLALGVCWHCGCHPLRVDALLQVGGPGKNREFAEHLARESSSPSSPVIMSPPLPKTSAAGESSSDVVMSAVDHSADQISQEAIEQL